jgi:hypothetical protein
MNVAEAEGARLPGPTGWIVNPRSSVDTVVARRNLPSGVRPSAAPGPRRIGGEAPRRKKSPYSPSTTTLSDPT